MAGGKLDLPKGLAKINLTCCRCTEEGERDAALVGDAGFFGDAVSTLLNRLDCSDTREVGVSLAADDVEENSDDEVLVW